MNHPVFVNAGDVAAVPILFVTSANFDEITKILGPPEHAFVRAAGFEPKPGRYLIVPAADGTLAGVLFGIEANDEPVKDPFRPGQLMTLLPAGTYRFANAHRVVWCLAEAVGARGHLPFRQCTARRAAGGIG